MHAARGASSKKLFNMCFTAFPNSFYGPGAWPHLWKNAMFRLQFVCNFSGMLQKALGENTASVSATFSINS